MESSMSSTIQPLSSSCDIGSNDESSEESGWTIYFEDFFAQKNNQEVEDNSHGEVHGSFSSDFSSSIVSDAASSIIVGKLVDKENFSLESNLLGNKNSKNLEFMKRKNKGVIGNDELEDTASSPANSPKDKGSNYGHYGERNEVEVSGRNCEDHDDMKLKKREFCVVPLVPNYIGN